MGPARANAPCGVKLRVGGGRKRKQSTLETALNHALSLTKQELRADSKFSVRNTLAHGKPGHGNRSSPASVKYC